MHESYIPQELSVCLCHAPPLIVQKSLEVMEVALFYCLCLPTIINPI